jgi:hypothetical protein
MSFLALVVAAGAALAVVVALLHLYAAWSIRSLGRPVEILDPGRPFEK